MKIEYLEIKNYKQFTDLTLDLTYPKGHEKEGEPLDKICIIGQSGTGKTNLLEIIKKSTVDFSEFSNDYYPLPAFTGQKDEQKFIFNKFKTKKQIGVEVILIDKNLEYFSNGKKVSKTSTITFKEKKKLTKDEKVYFVSASKTSISTELLNPQSHFINPATISKLNKLNKSIITINEKLNQSWKLLKEKIDNYASNKRAYKIKLYDESIKNPNYFKQSIIDMKKWEEENENILEKIEEDINSIIIKFNLQLQINENTQSYDELIIKDLANENIIEYEDLSTGTKNLLSTFIPLKSYNPKDSIILIDEPENSFYPDIQRELTDLYMNVGENNQLIMATHSPLIASSFEPWEVVELKFDKNNQIYREKYYEGENHIDNYTLDPRMLTWTGILTDIFDLKEDSNFTEREKKLMEYATLKAEIKAMDNIDEKEEAFKELKKISKILGFYNQ